MSKRGRSRRELPDPEEILAGRSADAGTLIVLIHSVNPTGHELAKKERERRYRLKSELQSLLVAQHGDDLEVIADDRDERMVTIRHRYLDRDACHAVIDELDDNARSWVRWQIDVAASPYTDAGVAPNRLAATPSPSPDVGPLRRGRTALAAYDYELARSCFEQALQSPEYTIRIRAARDLCSLLVDHLGSYDEVEAVGSSLDESIAQDVEVRLLLGLASARKGDEAAALRYLRGLDGARAAEALLVLAGTALDRRDAPTARRRLDDARACDPDHPELATVARRHAVLLAELRAPEEQALLSDADRELSAEVIARARQMFAKWPDSKAARQILARAAQAERVARAEILLADAERALDASDFASAKSFLSDPVCQSAPSERLRDLEARVAAGQRARAEAHRVEHVASICANLNGGDRRGGLLAYLELEADSRAKVRAAVQNAVLGWLDEVGRPKSAADAVQAVLALEEAYEIVQQDPSQALAIVGPHEAALRNLPALTVLRRQALKRAEARRKDSATTALLEAMYAADAEDFERVLLILDSLDPRGLDGQAREQADELRAHAEYRQRYTKALARVHALRARGELVPARSMVETLVADSTGEEREHCDALRADLEAGIVRQWRLVVSHEHADLSSVRSFDWNQLLEEPRAWLRKGGDELVLAETHGCWLFIRVVDLQTRRITTSAHMRLPADLGETTGQVFHDTLWVLGDAGGAVELGLSEWHPVRWIPPGTLKRPAEIVEHVFAASSRYIWSIVREDSRTRALVFDVEQERFCRELEGVYHAMVVTGPSEPVVVCSRSDRPMFARPNGSGRSVPSSKLMSLGTIVAAAAHPTASGIVGLWSLERDGADQEPALTFVDLAEHGGVFGLPEAYGIAPAVVATARRAVACFIVFTTRQGEQQLVCLAGEAVRFKYEMTVPPNLWLAQDLDGENVWAIWVDGEEVRWVPLDGNAPKVLVTRPADRRLPLRRPLLICGGLRGPRHATALAHLATFDEAGMKLPDYVERYFARHVDEPGTLTEFRYALELASPGYRPAAEQFQGWIAEHHPDHHDVLQRRAEDFINSGAWEQAHAALTAIEAGRVPEDERRHYIHLLAMAELAMGEPARALEALERAESLPDHGCELDGLRALAEEALAPENGEIHGGSTLHLGRQVVRALREADRRLGEGDARGAIEVLDHIPFHGLREVQVRARLAAAHLVLEPTTFDEFTKKVQALAAFCESHAQTGAMRREMILRVGTWSSEQFDKLASSADAFLENVEWPFPRRSR